MTYLVVVFTTLIIIIIGVLLWWYGGKPVKHRITIAHGNFRGFFDVLLYRGYDRGFLIIETPKRKDFIQFSKYMGNRKKVGLQFDFPLAPWSTNYFGILKNLLDQRGYDFEIQKIDPSNMQKFDSPVSQFLVVDLKQDLEAASELAKIALLEIFKLNPSDTVTLYFVNVSPREERIGF